MSKSPNEYIFATWSPFICQETSLKQNGKNKFILALLAFILMFVFIMERSSFWLHPMLEVAYNLSL